MLSTILTALILLIRLVQLMLVGRAILSWFPITQSPTVVRIYGFLHTVTEPVVMPVRKLFNRSAALRSLPVDLSLLGAYVLLEVLSRLIAVI